MITERKNNMVFELIFNYLLPIMCITIIVSFKAKIEMINASFNFFYKSC